MANRLANENSPYLLQHAHNPVDWYPWGEEALNRAKQENKPIFLSIGYAACHWCHVMEHESFENPDTAAIMNNYFVSIKVDREERPDLDSIYMAATTSMTGSGGWPMSVFLSPTDLRPFYAGTYFPPEPRFNMPSFPDLLLGIANAWQKERDEIDRVGGQVSEHIQHAFEWSPGAAYPLNHALLDNAASHLFQTYDWGFGGWGEAPKFPQPMAIEFLLRRATQDVETKMPDGRRNYLKTATHALMAMARGGMYDVVGGGFARYSVDNLWKTPHFEKMLYDNAQLAQAYLHAYLLTGDEQLRMVCERTLDFLLREMRHANGGFFSSLDADSEGQEGKYYIWDYSELENALGESFELFKTAYNLTRMGNTKGHDLEGKIILQRAMDDKTLAAHFGITEQDVSDRINSCHASLLTIREKRVRPGCDDKILASWNALAITALAEAGRYLERSDYTRAAQDTAHFILKNLVVEGRLMRSWRGSARLNAYLEDYASLALGFLALYQTDGDLAWYSTALGYAREMLEHFHDPGGGFYDTRDDHETLLVRPRDLQDNATPSGNALALHALLQIGAYGDCPEGLEAAMEMLAAMLETAVRYPNAFSKWLQAADFALGPTRQVVIIGAPGEPATGALAHTLWKNYHPRQMVSISAYPPAAGSPPLLDEKTPLQGQPTAYVCEQFACKLPVTTPQDFAAQLKSISGSRADLFHE